MSTGKSPHSVIINQDEMLDGTQMEHKTNGNQNDDVHRGGMGREIKMFFFRRLLTSWSVYFSYLVVSYSTSVSTVIFTSRAPLV